MLLLEDTDDFVLLRTLAASLRKRGEVDVLVSTVLSALGYKHYQAVAPSLFRAVIEGESEHFGCS